MASILVVDDDPILRAIATDILSDGGHTVSEAENGREAADAVGRERFDLVITDILMPDVDGLELIGRLKKSAQAVKILAISSGGSFHSKDVLDWATAVGADGILSKPLTRDRLLDAVSKLITA